MKTKEELREDMEKKLRLKERRISFWEQTHSILTIGSLLNDTKEVVLWEQRGSVTTGFLARIPVWAGPARPEKMANLIFIKI